MAHLKASINFGLVNIPVDIINAEDAQDAVHFHMLDSKDNSRIRFKRINENTGKEVEWEDIHKGYEVSKGKFITFTDDELEKLESDANQGLEIETFVMREEIPLVLFEAPYFLSPRDGAEKSYALLHRALVKTEKCAVVQAVLRSKEHLAVIFAEAEALIMCRLRYANEVKKTSEVLPSSINKVKLSEKEVAVAQRLVSEMEGTFEPQKYKDHYALKVKEAIRRKTKSGKVKSSKQQPEKKSSSKVTDIMELLNRSISQKSSKQVKRKKAA